MADTSDTPTFGLLDNSQLLQHLSQEQYEKNSQEMKRLQSLYVLSH